MSTSISVLFATVETNLDALQALPMKRASDAAFLAAVDTLATSITALGNAINASSSPPPSPPPPPPPPPSPSANGTLITAPNGTITDDSGNLWGWGAQWTADGNSDGWQITLNGAVQAGTWATEMYYENEVVYQTNAASGWWAWENGAWTSVSNPIDPPAPPPPPPPPPSTTTTTSTAPAPAAAVGYNTCVLDIETWSDSDLDMGTGASGFPFYNDGFYGPAPNSALSITDGQLTISGGMISTGSWSGAYGNPNPTTGNGEANLNPSVNWTGTAYGPGVYCEVEMQFNPSEASSGSWPALWGNTFWNIFNNGQLAGPSGIKGGVETDWAEMIPAALSVPAFNAGVIEWEGQSAWTATEGNNDDGTDFQPSLDSSPFSSDDWNFNEMHTYAVLIVPAAQNGGTGYMKTFVDGNLYSTAEWGTSGNYSRLNTDPWLLEIGNGQDGGAGSMTIGRVRIFVESMSQVTSTFPVSPVT